MKKLRKKSEQKTFEFKGLKMIAQNSWAQIFLSELSFKLHVEEMRQESNSEILCGNNEELPDDERSWLQLEEFFLFTGDDNLQQFHLTRCNLEPQKTHMGKLTD